MQKLSPQPPAGSKLWQGHSPGHGAVYIRPCVTGHGVASEDIVGEAFWAANRPPVVDPAEVARQAVDKMLLAGPDITSPKPAPPGGCGSSGRAPKGHGCYTVGVPVWMSLATSRTTWGPNTASASAGGVTVKATATVSTVSWSMGDGTTVTCTTPGTPYKSSYGAKQSPDCGHRYTRPSTHNKGGLDRLAATSTWRVRWKGGGQQGVLTETRTSRVPVSVHEVQVVS